MLGKPLVSIIIPIYNVEAYLEKCLSTVYELVIDNNIEVILVNDGSTDQSIDIAKKYELANMAATKLVTRVNGGLSAARNTGLASANGTWIYFLDSDDFIDPKALQRVFNHLSITKADVVSFTGFRYYEDTETNLDLYAKPNPFSELQCVTGIHYLSEIINLGMTNTVTVWDKIYKSSILKELKLSFIEGLIHEDIPFTFTLFTSEIMVEHMPEKVIFYRQREGSIMSTSSPKKLESRLYILNYLITLSKTTNKFTVALNDYIVFVAKNIVADGGRIPNIVITKLFNLNMSVRKRAILLLYITKNFRNKQVNRLANNK